MPKAAAARKAAIKDEESREKILARINAQLKGEETAYGLVGTAREKVLKFAELEAQLVNKGGTQGTGLKERVSILVDQAAAQNDLEASYRRVLGPQQDFYSALNGANMALELGYINQQQFDKEIGQATRAWELYLDPMKQVNEQYEDQMRLLNAITPEQELQAEAINKVNQAKREGNALDLQTIENQARAQRNAAAVKGYAQGYGQQGMGQIENLQNQKAGLQTAAANGQIGSAQFTSEITRLNAELSRTAMLMGGGDTNGAIQAGLARFVEGFRGALAETSDLFGNFFLQIGDGFANSIGNWIVQGGSLKDALGDIARQGLSQIIAGLVKVGIQTLLMGGIAATATTAATAASVAAAGVTAAAWATPAALVNAATFGAGATAGTLALAASVTAAEAMAMASLFAGYKAGGYTGNGGVSDVAGVVHGKEFVVNAAGTRRNRGALEAMNSGKSIGGNIAIYNNGGVDVEAHTLSSGDIEIMIDRKMRSQVPGIVGNQLSRRNSTVSKSMEQNIRAPRKL